MTPLRSLSRATASLTGSDHRVLARGLVAEFELIDDDVVLRIEFAAVDLVVQLRGELALGDVVARELAGIRIEDAQLDVAKAHRQIGVERRAQEVDLTGDRYRRERIDVAVQIDLRTRARL